jgi:hypothetical protein
VEFCDRRGEIPLVLPDRGNRATMMATFHPAGCASKPSTLTGNDLGYLRALYKMSPDRNL